MCPLSLAIKRANQAHMGLGCRKVRCHAQPGVWYRGWNPVLYAGAEVPSVCLEGLHPGAPWQPLSSGHPQWLTPFPYAWVPSSCSLAQVCNPPGLLRLTQAPDIMHWPLPSARADALGTVVPMQACAVQGARSLGMQWGWCSLAWQAAMGCGLPWHGAVHFMMVNQLIT